MNQPESTQSPTSALVIDGVPTPDYNARRVVARDAVIEAAREVRKARRRYVDAGCPDPLAPRYKALNVALDALDALER